MQIFKDGFIDRTLKELKKWGTLIACPIDTVYLGGGTPSVLSPTELKKLLDGIRDNFTLTEDAEITCEINPKDDIEALAEILLPAGVNRISIGMQSANQKE